VRRVLSNLGLAAVSVALSLAAAEVALRAWGYRFSPIQFLTPENPNDWRAFHMGANDPRLSEREPLTLFDGELLWRLNPEASAEINAQGFRGPLFPQTRAPEDIFVLAVGDSNTLGPLTANDHWPGFLDDLVRTDPSRRVRVVNAGVYGYTALQGLRRFRQAAARRPDVVLFSFGANDAQPVRTTDAAYAARVGWLRRWEWSRIAPPLAHLFLKARARLGGTSARTHRVPLADYRRILETFVDEARAAGATPVLLTRPWIGRSEDPELWMTHAAPYDDATRSVAASKQVLLVDAHAAFRERPELFSDPLHFTRVGNRAMAELVLRRLQSAGVAAGASGFRPGPAIELNGPDERRPELGSGFSSFERPADGPPGRWTDGGGVLTLGRRRQERGLALDLSNLNPLPLTAGHVEVNGRVVFDFRERRGRMRPLLDIGDVPGESLTVRFVTAPVYVPREHDAASRDVRRLGVFVHAARLVDAPFASEVDLADADVDSPELREGWFDAETWPDGRRGRWSSARAELILERPAAQSRLVIDASAENGRNHTAATVAIGGRTVGTIGGPNGRRQHVLPIPAGVGRRLHIVLRVQEPYVAARHAGAGTDTRALGLFVHSVRLVPSAHEQHDTRPVGARP
jgi:lysophospholipase L1-like esterase